MTDINTSPASSHPGVRPLPALATGAFGWVLGLAIGAAMLSTAGKALLLIALVVVIGPSLIFRRSRLDVGRWLMHRMGALADRLSPGFAPRGPDELRLRRVTYVVGLLSGAAVPFVLSVAFG